MASFRQESTNTTFVNNFLYSKFNCCRRSFFIYWFWWLSSIFWRWLWCYFRSCKWNCSVVRWSLWYIYWQMFKKLGNTCSNQDNEFSIYNFQNKTVQTIIITEPAKRLGHTMVYVPTRRRYFLTGTIISILI